VGISYRFPSSSGRSPTGILSLPDLLSAQSVISFERLLFRKLLNDGILNNLDLFLRETVDEDSWFATVDDDGASTLGRITPAPMQQREILFSQIRRILR